jgi:hypothetical protein
MGAVTMLERLGHTADDVAITLRAKRIRGVRYTVQFLNPVIRYVRTEIADARYMEIVDGDRLSITFDDGRKTNVSLPQAAKEFLDAFNQRAYLDLELPVGSP